jgi:hypothetical protein
MGGRVQAWSMTRLTQHCRGGSAGIHPSGSIRTAPQCSQKSLDEGAPSSAIVDGWEHLGMSCSVWRDVLRLRLGLSNDVTPGTHLRFLEDHSGGWLLALLAKSKKFLLENFF